MEPNTLISREQALKNRVFTSFVGTWQKRFDPRHDPYMTGAGNYYDSEIDKDRFLQPGGGRFS